MNEGIVTPVDVVNAQLRAYNARDIEAFAATYAEDVCIYGMPHAKLSLRGKVKLVESYGSKTFKNEGLRAEVLSRQVIGNKVIDHEKTWGLKAEPLEFMVVYEVVNGLINAVWFFQPSGTSSAPNEA
jgi:hypothetical protein